MHDIVSGMDVRMKTILFGWITESCKGTGFSCK